MTAAELLVALELPPVSDVGRRVPKTQLLEHGAPTAGDRRAINEGIERVTWVAALKPGTVAIAPVSNVTREYLEIHVLRLEVREARRLGRLVELAHRAVPYPVVLVTEQDAQVHLSLAHKRWSQAEIGRTVLDDGIVSVSWTDDSDAHACDFLAALPLRLQVGTDLYALYQSWIDVALALQAARRTGRFEPRRSTDGAQLRRQALRTCDELDEEVQRLRAAAKKEKQMARLADLNLAIQRAEAEKAGALNQL